jgi:hypothetical protein
MNHDNTSPALCERGDPRLLLRGEIPPSIAVNDEHVRLVEFLLSGKRVRSFSDGSPLIQERHPVPQKGRMIVRTRPVRLGTGADENPQRRRNDALSECHKRDEAQKETDHNELGEVLGTAGISERGATQMNVT